MNNAEMKEAEKRLFELQKEYGGIGFIRVICTELWLGDLREARFQYHQLDLDILQKEYPSVASAMIDIFGCHIHGVKDCDHGACQNPISPI